MLPRNLAARRPLLLAAPLLVALAGCGSGSAKPPAARPSPPPQEVPVTSPAPPAPGAPAGWQHDWVRGAVFYEVFVRSFADADGDGKGDLKGLTAKLDYLNDGDPATTTDLGIDALWLMPIFASPSYHGYDTVDYETINPDYGTGEDFDRLLREAHKRGIRVIVDLVLNHTSDQHPWFVDAKSAPTARHRDWYVWRADDPGWTQPWGNGHTWHAAGDAFYYGLFWGGMPDLNWRNPEVRAEMARIAEGWLRRGVDGFRLDASRHLVEDEGADGKGVLFDAPETHTVLQEFSSRVRAANPKALLVGENWTETPIIARYFGASVGGDPARGSDELPMSFNFPLASAIVGALKWEEAAGIAAKLEEMAELYPAWALDAPFLTNHDQIRLATELGGDPAHLRSAAAILLTLPGTPFLYYGEEIGLANGPGGKDEWKRTPMPWDGSAGGGFSTGKPWYGFAPGREAVNVAAETGDPASLLAHYRALVAARKASPALRLGRLELLTRGNVGSPTLAFLRRAPEETVLVVHNLKKEIVTAGPFLAGTKRLVPLFATVGAVPTATAGAEGWRIELPAGGSGVWRVEG